MFDLWPRSNVGTTYIKHYMVNEFARAIEKAHSIGE
jgi:hypothetical protein